MSAGSLLGRRAMVEVPATIANLGAGYDCLGLAVEVALRVSVEVVPSGIELSIEGHGVGELAPDRSNRLVEALELGLAALDVDDVEAVGWRIALSNPIPLQRGLGSSAAATVAGLVLAGAIAGRELPEAALLRHATAIEGHPDNVAPALLGGLVASVADGDAVEAVRLEPPAVAIVAWIPDRRLPTDEMRRVLPQSVPRADAVANLARVAIGVSGLASGRLDVLRLLMEDRLHEPYRSAVYPELPRLERAARDAGALGACLAGAGSTVAAFAEPERADEVGQALEAAAGSADLPGRLARLAPRAEGARVLART